MLLSATLYTFLIYQFEKTKHKKIICENYQLNYFQFISIRNCKCTLINRNGFIKSINWKWLPDEG